MIYEIGIYLIYFTQGAALHLIVRLYSDNKRHSVISEILSLTEVQIGLSANT